MGDSLVAWRCPHCGTTARVPASTPRVQCFCSEKPTPPGILARGQSYVTAWVRWTTAGMPTRTPEQVAAIRAICAACEHFDGENCTKCGCRVAGAGWLGDKVLWSTDHCPIKMW